MWGPEGKSGDPFTKLSPRDVTQQLAGDFGVVHPKHSQRAEALEQADEERGVIPTADAVETSEVDIG